MKTKIEVNGKEIDVDLENLKEDELGDYNIHINDDITHHIYKYSPYKKKVLRKVKSVLSIICFMAFLLCGLLIDKGFRWSWALLLLIPVINFLYSLRNKSARRIIASILIVMILGSIFTFGFVFSLWSWIWVFFFLIPIVLIITE